MSVRRSNLSAYNKAMTGLFIAILDNDYRKRSLMKSVHNAKSFEKVIAIIDSDLKKNYPYGAPEDSWMTLLRRVRDAWLQIKAAKNDRQVIVAFIDLYNKLLGPYYMWVPNEVKEQLAKVGNLLKLDAADDQLLKAFVRAKKNPIIHSSGRFKLPEIVEPEKEVVKPSALQLNEEELKDIHLASAVPPATLRGINLFAKKSTPPTATQDLPSRSRQFN